MLIPGEAVALSGEQRRKQMGGEIWVMVGTQELGVAQE